MKNIKWLLLLLLSSPALTAQSTITIKGNIVNNLDAYNEIYYAYNGDPLDTIKVIDGKFEIVMPFRKGDLPWLHDQYSLKKHGGLRSTSFLIEHPGTVTISDIDLNQGFIGNVSGMQSAIDYMEFYLLDASIDTDLKVREELKTKYPVTPEYNNDGNLSPEFIAYNDDYNEVAKKYTAINLEKFIKSHPDSYASLRLLEFNMGNMDTETLERNYVLLSKKRQNSDEGKEVKKFINAIKSTLVNSQMKDFSLLNPEGEKISTKSLRGKYVLIDFWASWCSPCIAEFPNFKEVYKKYKDKNFEILSISVDKSSAPWLKALQKHKLPWLQVIDEKHSQTANYAVSGYPTKFLIDPKGKIIMRDGNIEQKLTEIFGY